MNFPGTSFLSALYVPQSTSGCAIAFTGTGFDYEAKFCSGSCGPMRGHKALEVDNSTHDVLMDIAIVPVMPGATL